MGRRIAGTTGLIAAAALFALAPGAVGGPYDYGDQGGGSQQPAQASASGPKDVDANGNPFTGGLAFDPASVSVRVGQIVRWTNRDAFVPHTATEDHDLWDLAGDYGAGPFPRGFGPGESRQRAFEAGTQGYYCKVHPEQMKGVVAVPVTLAQTSKRLPGRNGKPGRKVRLVTARWAAAAPVRGEGFDVRRRHPGGAWQTIRNGTSDTRTSWRAGRTGTRWQVQARLRRSDNRAKATGWSPVASIMS
jgi:plastocyanin